MKKNNDHDPNYVWEKAKDDRNVVNLADELIMQQTYPPRIVKYTEESYATQMYSYEAGGYELVAEYRTYEDAKRDFVNWTTAWDLLKKIIINDISNSKVVAKYQYS